jgi:integrase
VKPVHGLRHTLATHAARSGADIKVLSDRLGHASVYTTLDRYRHVDDADRAESIAMGEMMVGGG